MITRFRLEAEAENDEEVEDKLEAATQAMLGFLRDVQPEDRWVETDKHISPWRDAAGNAVIFGRVVYRRKEMHVLDDGLGPEMRY